MMNIPDWRDINMDKIPPYIKPSNDLLLAEFAKTINAKYIMSTSTISQCLSQFYYLMTHFQNPMIECMPTEEPILLKKYMVSQRKPVTNIIKKIDAEKKIYAMDSDSNPFASKIEVLLQLGKVLERMYVMSIEDFQYLFMKGHESECRDVAIDEDYHRYMSVNNEICLRSQIDCMSEMPNGDKIVFEIKSRAVAPIRYDLENYTNYLDYQINQVSGLHSSFEREYFDLIRGGFLKYFFQLKIGQMQGAFIGYHNTLSHFGFEYIDLSKIERALFGDSFRADQAFVLLSKMLTTVLDEILQAVDHEDFSFFRIGSMTRLLRPSIFGPTRNLFGILLGFGL